MERSKERVKKSTTAKKQNAKDSVVTPETTEDKRVIQSFQLWEILAVAGLLLMLTLQLAMSIGGESATMDEQNHIARGLAYLRTGDTRLNTEHPPLIGAISALPLVFNSQIILPIPSASWQNRKTYDFAEEFLWGVNQNGSAIVDRARIPILFLTLLLGLTCYLWGRELYGVYAGLVALILVTFDPNILAHGKLATNDLGMALFSTASLYTFWRFLRKPGWGRATVAGVILGLALTAKFSALFLLGAQGLMTIADYWMASGKKRTRQRLFQWLIMNSLVVFTAGVVVWAVYGFQIGPLHEAGISLPAPDYINGAFSIAGRVENGNPSFLLGQYSLKGWWYYFPVVFIVKTPLPSLLIIGAAFIYAIRRREVWQEAVRVLIPVALYFAMSLNSSLNIGYRHLLPILPLLFIFAGQTENLLKRDKLPSTQNTEGESPRAAGFLAVGKSRWGLVLVVPLVWLMVETALIFPDHLAYFNELVGGSSRGYKVLADSNLDWGQGLIQLREYMAKENLDSVKLSYFGSAHPEQYGIVSEPLPAFPRNMALVGAIGNTLDDPPAGVYAISVTNLQGVFFANHELYNWFRARKPDAVIGHSIFIYRVE